MRLIMLLCSLLALTAALAGDLYTASFTSPIALQLPAMGQAKPGGAAKPRVFWRAGNGKWQPAPVEADKDRLLFKLDPAKLGSSEVMLLINPPAGLVLDDFEGPKLTGLKVDGKAAKIGAIIDAGAMKAAPKQIVASFADAANALAPGSEQVTVDGATVAATAVGSGKSTTLTMALPPLEYGKHEIALAAADASPQRNVTRVVIRFDYIESGNVALAAQGATVAVDSSFSGYESLTPLNDGITPPPGEHAGNDITWASAETPTDHWIEVTLLKPTPIKEVSVYWTSYTAVSHTAKAFQVQIPEGTGWKAVYTSPAEGEKVGPVTTARFAPVTVSKFRVFMPTGKGSDSRPNLLWVSEVKAR